MGRRQGRRDRRHRRYDVEGVVGSLLFSVEVTILDISAGGMQVETASRLMVGRRYSFRLQREGRTLQVKGKVAWSVLTGTARLAEGEVAPVYKAGIAFERTLTEEGRELVDFIQESITVRPELRLFGRLQVTDDRPATAELGSGLAVKRLSLSGMLVESELDSRLDEVLTMEVRLGEVQIAVSGRVAYVSQGAGAGGSNQLGIEFLDLTEHQRAAISRFVEQEFSEEDATAGDAGE